MDLRRKRRSAGVLKESYKFYFLIIIPGIFFRVLLAASEPVCYTRKVLDDRNTVITTTDCDGDPSQIYMRFNSRRDVDWSQLMNPPDEVEEKRPSSTEEKTNENEAEAFTCSEWNEWRGSRYKLLNTEQTWEQSNTTCQEEHSDAHLVYIENQEENDFVVQVLQNCSSPGPWIGLTDQEKEGTWKWGYVNASYFNWGLYNGAVDSNDGPDQNCVKIDSVTGQWHDQTCQYLYMAFCEHEIVS